MNFCCRQKSSTMLTITFQCLTKNETKVSPRRQRGGLVGLTAQTNTNFLLLAPRQTVSIFCYFTRSTIRLTKFWYYFSPFPHVNCFYRYFSTFNIKLPCSFLCYSLISQKANFDHCLGLHTNCVPFNNYLILNIQAKTLIGSAEHK